MEEDEVRPPRRAAGFNPIMEGGEGFAREGSQWTLVLGIKWLLGLLESGCAGAREGPEGELKFCSRPRFLGSSSPREHRSDLFQHLTFNHDKTVGKLIVLRDIKHQTPLILSARDAGCILIGRVPACGGVFFLPMEAPSGPHLSLSPPGVGAEGRGLPPPPHLVLAFFP